tara:strand:+ start:21993 stop:24131 length:2139 start_codon:yes stop_codon:yes gene_type:complete
MRSLLGAALVLLATLGVTAQDWPAVRETTLEVAPGSPLDFSAILPNGSINAARRVIIANGRFAMSDAPDRPLPLLCASLAWSPASGGFPDHDGADRYARQLAMHGYNVARLHFMESALMFGRQDDFDFDPEVLDRIHYLLAALKREGISWIVDGMTSARGGLGGHDDRWDGKGDLKQSVLLEASGLAHWRQLQQAILGTVNPYTGIAPIADPALALIVLVNEGGLEFDSIVAQGQGAASYSPMITTAFNAWLRRHYADSAALAAAWGGLSGGESLEQGSIALPANRYAPSPRYRDVQRFFIEAETAGTAAMSAILREMGYQGAISNYNNWPILQANVSRRDLEALTMNIYFDWVSGYAPGTRIEQQSSIAKGLDYIRLAASTRRLGRPFVLTEYDHLFWNRYRYEAGLAVPAFAAFQGWDGLCRHGHGPIALRYGEEAPHKRQMLPYAIALDPVARAGETLAALLFRRGDVAPSAITIGFATDGDSGLGPSIAAREPEELTALMALGAIGLQEGDGTGVPADRASTDLSAMVAQLRRDGAIGQDAVDAMGRGRYESDTGQIAVVPGQRLMQLVTPRTVAAAFESLDTPLQLGPATLLASTTPALFALAALDDLDLDESRRILVIMATDARNTDMTFADADAREIVDFGYLPVRIRPGTVTFDLEGSGPWRIAPVGLDGVVGDILAQGSGRIALSLDNATPRGPTTYFVIERD